MGEIFRKIFIDKKIEKHIRGWLYQRFWITSYGRVQIGRNNEIDRQSIKSAGNLRIGNSNKIKGNNIILGNHVTFGNHCLILSDFSSKSSLQIGNRFGSGDNNLFGAAGGIKIGDDVIFGQNIRLHAQNHNFDNLLELIVQQGTTEKGIVIGNNCWIGSGAVFLDGVTIGDGCVVGANSVVTKSFPKNSVIAGNPAKIIRQRGEI